MNCSPLRAQLPQLTPGKVRPSHCTQRSVHEQMCCGCAWELIRSRWPQRALKCRPTTDELVEAAIAPLKRTTEMFLRNTDVHGIHRSVANGANVRCATSQPLHHVETALRCSPGRWRMRAKSRWRRACCTADHAFGAAASSETLKTDLSGDSACKRAQVMREAMRNRICAVACSRVDTGPHGAASGAGTGRHNVHVARWGLARTYDSETSGVHTVCCNPQPCLTDAAGAHVHAFGGSLVSSSSSVECGWPPLTTRSRSMLDRSTLQPIPDSFVFGTPNPNSLHPSRQAHPTRAMRPFHAYASCMRLYINL